MLLSSDYPVEVETMAGIYSLGAGTIDEVQLWLETLEYPGFFLFLALPSPIHWPNLAVIQPTQETAGANPLPQR